MLLNMRENVENGAGMWQGKTTCRVIYTLLIQPVRQIIGRRVGVECWR